MEDITLRPLCQAQFIQCIWVLLYCQDDILGFLLMPYFLGFGLKEHTDFLFKMLSDCSFCILWPQGRLCDKIVWFCSQKMNCFFHFLSFSSTLCLPGRISPPACPLASGFTGTLELRRPHRQYTQLADQTFTYPLYVSVKSLFCFTSPS